MAMSRCVGSASTELGGRSYPELLLAGLPHESRNKRRCLRNPFQLLLKTVFDLGRAQLDGHTSRGYQWQRGRLPLNEKTPQNEDIHRQK